jgi:hypothetical protein
MCIVFVKLGLEDITLGFVNFISSAFVLFQAMVAASKPVSLRRGTIVSGGALKSPWAPTTIIVEGLEWIKLDKRDRHLRAFMECTSKKFGIMMKHFNFKMNKAIRLDKQRVSADHDLFGEAPQEDSIKVKAPAETECWTEVNFPAQGSLSPIRMKILQRVGGHRLPYVELTAETLEWLRVLAKTEEQAEDDIFKSSHPNVKWDSRMNKGYWIVHYEHLDENDKMCKKRKCFPVSLLSTECIKAAYDKAVKFAEKFKPADESSSDSDE